MKLFYTSSTAITLLSLVGSLILSQPVLAQVTIINSQTQTEPTQTSESGQVSDTAEASEPSETSEPNGNLDTTTATSDSTTSPQEAILGYACYSSPSAERIPTTYAIFGKDNSQPRYIPIIRWTSTTFQNSGYPPERRCQIISERLNRFLEQGTLEYIIEGSLSGQDVLFAASQLVAFSGQTFALEPAQPDNNNLIITLEPQDDPATFLSTFGSVLKAQQNPISRGSRWIKVPKEINAEEVLTEVPVEVQNLETQTPETQTPETQVLEVQNAPEAP